MIPGTCDTATTWETATAAKVGRIYCMKFLLRFWVFCILKNETNCKLFVSNGGSFIKCLSKERLVEMKTWKNPAWHPQTVPFLLPAPLQHHLLLQCTRLSFQTFALFFQNSSLSLSNRREDIFLSKHIQQGCIHTFRCCNCSWDLTELAATFLVFFWN